MTARRLCFDATVRQDLATGPRRTWGVGPPWVVAWPVQVFANVLQTCPVSGLGWCLAGFFGDLARVHQSSARGSEAPGSTKPITCTLTDSKDSKSKLTQAPLPISPSPSETCSCCSAQAKEWMVFRTKIHPQNHSALPRPPLDPQQIAEPPKAPKPCSA